MYLAYGTFTGSLLPTFTIIGFIFLGCCILAYYLIKKDKSMIPKSEEQMIPESGLTFDELRQKIFDRSIEAYANITGRKDLSYYGNALAGEVGEACNLIKKMERGDPIPASELGKELADIVVYADIIAAKNGLSLGQCVRNKFNEVSDRIGSNVKFK